MNIFKYKSRVVILMSIIIALIFIFRRDYHFGNYIFAEGSEQMDNKINKTDEEWKKELSSEEYHILRQKGTEPAFSGKYYYNKEKGVYCCKACGNELFSSETKFESGTGWPSFYAPLSDEKLSTDIDRKYGFIRTEVLCARCGGHLGHVFNDGPDPTGLRYCINSEALDFKREEDVELEKATFGAGCFWGIEAAFRKIKGVISTSVGYSGGTKDKPTYRDVCRGDTGHAEAVEVTYDPSKVSYEELLNVFWDIHNPTTFNRQGPDIGSQYRSAIFYHNEEQRKQAIASKENLQRSGKYPERIVTEIKPASAFYKAEEYHQNYYGKQNIFKSCK